QLRGAPRPWLARIAHNEARSLARVRREHVSLDAVGADVANGTDPAEAVLAKERLTLLAADVGALPERLRRPLLLRAGRGLSYRGVGAALGARPAARPPGGGGGALALGARRAGGGGGRPAVPRVPRGGRPPAPPLAPRPCAPARVPRLPRLAAAAP